jgi:hypothetical protein
MPAAVAVVVGAAAVVGVVELAQAVVAAADSRLRRVALPARQPALPLGPALHQPALVRQQEHGPALRPPALVPQRAPGPALPPQAVPMQAHAQQRERGPAPAMLQAGVDRTPAR